MLKILESEHLCQYNDKEKLVADAQAELHSITEWMRVNNLNSNPSKTEYMIIGHLTKAKCTNAPTGLELGNKEIKRVFNTKSLGVMVDEYLNWCVVQRVGKLVNMYRT